MRSVSVMYHGMFNVTKYELPQVVVYKCDIKEDSQFHTNLKYFMSDNDFICSTISVNNQDYKNGDLVVVSIEDCDNLSVGLTQTILIKENKVYFVIKRYKATRNWLQFFESENPNDEICEFVESDNLIDFKPLIKRGTSQHFSFTLHHHVSYDYE